MPKAGKRLLFAAIGIFMTGIAIIGIWLPVIPTVPPLLIALWAFSNSSNRLHGKLLKIPLLKTALQEAAEYEKHRSVTRRTKQTSQACAWASVAVVIIFSGNIWAALMAAMLASCCSLFMYLTPTRAPGNQVEAVTD